MNQNCQARSEPAALANIADFFTTSYGDLKRRVIDWASNSIVIVNGSELVLLEAQGGAADDPAQGNATRLPDVTSHTIRVGEELNASALTAPSQGTSMTETKGIVASENRRDDSNIARFHLNRTTFPFQPQIYQELKAFCHLSLSVVAIFAARDALPVNLQAETKKSPAPSCKSQVPVDSPEIVVIEANVPEQAQMLISHTRALLRSMDTEAALYELSIQDPELWKQNYEMAKDTLDFLECTQKSETVATSTTRPIVALPADSVPTKQDLTAFIHRQSEIYTKNIHLASHSSVQALDQSLRRLLACRRADHSSSSSCPDTCSLAKRTLHFVVTGEHMPEKDNLITQYLLATKGPSCRKEGDQVYYATGKYTDQDVVGFVAQHVADGYLGGAVFGDSEAMHRDILADGAKSIVDLFKREG